MTTTATMSTASPPAMSSPPDAVGSPPTISQPVLSPPTTSRQNTLSRPLSYASKNRLSQYSVGSIPSRSRPQSHIFPMFPSTLPYTQVRDFAYPIMHPMHYGAPPEPSGPPSGLTTPASERRLSDPPVPWDQKMPWDSWTGDGFNRGHDLPPIHFGDGPPYSEDEDLQSPVVSTRHRKHKSTSAALGPSRGRTVHDGPGIVDGPSFDNDRSYFAGTMGDGSERYYVSRGSEANGPGGEYITYPPDPNRHHHQYQYNQQRQGAEMDEYRSGSEHSSAPSSPGYQADQSRYSRDYQFTITSPDEEFHGKAVALFDFERENENELPLVEGQIIWVSYRHGQGWLVAEDPKTQESGLVPEEYVRLLRDIEGGMNSLTGQLGDGTGSPNEVGTPTQLEHTSQFGHTPTPSNPTNGYHQPVVSMFSTSSKDLNPYPTEQLGIQAGQAPPQVVHYHGQRGGSQINTPTFSQLQETLPFSRDSQDGGSKERSDTPTAQGETTSVPPAIESTAEVMDTD